MNNFPIDVPGILYAVSTVADGNMSFKWGAEEVVRENRNVFFAQHRIDPARCVMMHVPHGDDISIISSAHAGKGMEARDATVEVDAFVTNVPNIVLCLMTADCLPIVMYDPVKRAIALAHLGWKSTGALLSKKVVATMTSAFQSNPSDLSVHIGPGIHQQSYILSSAQQVTDPAWAPYVQQHTDGFAIDLVGYNRDQMIAVGVAADRITVNDHDTGASAEYFSHYRSQRTGESEGRFLTCIQLRT